jgi:hypothetical protein
VKILSQNLVEKLKLETKNHPHPYNLKWLQTVIEMEVNKRCLVEFSIGKDYTDVVMCDVVHIVACHSLLGRPWQYDRRAIHDGYKNTCSFVKDGVKVVLDPAKIESHPEPFQGAGNNLLSKSQFTKVLAGSNMTYALLVIEENDKGRGSSLFAAFASRVSRCYT